MIQLTEKTRVACVHEDRLECLIGLKLTVLSLIDCCPDLPVIISCPYPTASFCNWARPLSNVRIVSYPELAGLGWNVKPTVLLRLLEDGYPEVIWIDSDIVVNGDFRERVSRLDDKTLVVAQECYWEEQDIGTHRTIAWGLEPSRPLATIVNTGVVRVTHRHITLLKAWQTMLHHPVYIQAQRLPVNQRPRHMLSDQEALTALLGSRECADVPVDILERGLDIAQCLRASGYTAIERLHSLRSGLPALIHAMCLPKPWNKAPSPSAIWHSPQPIVASLRDYFVYINLELSPYVSIACKYREQVGEDTAWMELKSFPAKVFGHLFAHHPVLQGFPLSLLEAGLRHVSRLFKRPSPSVDANFRLQQSPFDLNSQ